MVIGILIALSINNWNENRKALDLERIYIDRILDDLEEEELYIQSSIDYNQNVQDFAEQSIGHFEDPDLALENPKQNLINLYQASQINDARTTASTYKELNAYGQINLLRDYSLRSSLISYYELDWINFVLFEIPNYL